MTSSSGNTQRRFDPVVTEIIRNGMFAATEEMKSNLMRTAYNMIIYEADCLTEDPKKGPGHTVNTQV